MLGPCCLLLAVQGLLLLHKGLQLLKVKWGHDRALLLEMARRQQRQLRWRRLPLGLGVCFPWPRAGAGHELASVRGEVGADRRIPVLTNGQCLRASCGSP